MADYTLPDLPYDYGALDPHISGKIMELHHGKHHQNYVNGLNATIEKMDEAHANNSFDTINQLEKNLAFNLGGHVNHSIFWKNLSPEGGDKPDGDLGAAIDDQYGVVRHVPRPVRGHRTRHPGVRLGHRRVGHPRPEARHGAAVRPPEQPVPRP